MLQWSIVFLLVAVIAGIIGFMGGAGFPGTTAKILCLIFIVISAVTIVWTLTIGRRPTVDLTTKNFGKPLPRPPHTSRR